MGATKTAGVAAGRDEALVVFRDESCSGPRFWWNGAGDSYGRHSHGYHKVLFCLAGAITFHLPDGDVELVPGDRLDIEPDTEHSATVGPQGVECVEASR